MHPILDARPIIVALAGPNGAGLAKLNAAIKQLPLVLIYDNSDLSAPFRRIAEYQHGTAHFLARPLPKWLPQLQ